MELYLLVSLDRFKDFLEGGAAIFTIALFIAIVITPFTMLADEDNVIAKKMAISSVIASFSLVALLSMINAFIPTTREAAFIYVGNKIINNEAISKLGNDAVNLSGKILKFANEYVDSMSENKKEK